MCIALPADRWTSAFFGGESLFPDTGLEFGLWLEVVHPRFINCDDLVQERVTFSPVAQQQLVADINSCGSGYL